MLAPGRPGGCSGLRAAHWRGDGREVDHLGLHFKAGGVESGLKGVCMKRRKQQGAVSGLGQGGAWGGGQPFPRDPPEPEGLLGPGNVTQCPLSGDNNMFAASFSHSFSLVCVHVACMF